MANLLNIAQTGLQASQTQLGVTGNNIANVGTDGYNRQVGTQGSSESYFSSGHFIGSGTYISDVSRVYNEFAQRELSLATSQHSHAEARYTKLSELDQLFSVVGQSVTDSLDHLFANVNSLVDQPSDLGVRDNVITSAEQITAAFNTMGKELEEQRNQVNDQISGVIERINNISSELAHINEQLQAVQGQDPQMLDQQNRLINELSGFVQISVTEQADGVKSVMAGGSVMLVAGESPITLGITQGNPVVDQHRITASSGEQTVVLNTDGIGGQLQALMDYRDNDLDGAMQELSLMALGVSNAFNQAQSDGLDLNGSPGQNLFTDINSPSYTQGRVSEYQQNSGDQSLGVMITDPGQLGTGRYELSFDGTDYQLTDQYGKSETLVLDTDTGLYTSQEGFAIELQAGTAAAGDRWNISPTANVAVNLQTELSDPRDIAAASYQLENNDATAAGSAQLVSVDRTDANFPQGAVNISVDKTAGTFEITDPDGNVLSTGTISADQQISALGFTIELDNQVVDGDSFTLDLSFGQGDNSNATAMAGLATEKLMDSGNATLADILESTTTSIGSQTNAAEVSLTSAETVKAQSENRVLSESGVNLDEEAANLLKFQQAYEASARVMSVAQQIFDSLFAAVR